MKKEHKNRFRELAAQGKLSDLCRDHFCMNLSVRTIGGTVFWNTAEYCGWNFQEYRISGHWRILDPGNIRRAWGITITSHHLNGFFAFSAVCEKFQTTACDLCSGRSKIFSRIYSSSWNPYACWTIVLFLLLNPSIDTLVTPPKYHKRQKNRKISHHIKNN